MKELLRFLNAYEVEIYVLLGAVGILYIRKLLLAIQAWRGAMFGMERNLAQRKLSESGSILILLTLLAVGEFSLVSFVSPTLPGVHVLATPTLDILATPAGTAEAQVTSAPLGARMKTPQPTSIILSSTAGCLPGALELTFPIAGQEVKEKVTLTGTVKTASFSYYKYEFSKPGDTDWTTIQAGDQIKCKDCAKKDDPNPPDDILGEWDTSQLVPGDYLLRLVVFDNQGQPLPACQIPIRVSAP